MYYRHIRAVSQYEGISESSQTESAMKYMHSTIIGGHHPLPSFRQFVQCFVPVLK